MNDQFSHVSTTSLARQTIAVSDGCLSIGDQTFSPEDTDLVLETLLIARNGLQTVDDDEE